MAGEVPFAGSNKLSYGPGNFLGSGAYTIVVLFNPSNNVTTDVIDWLATSTEQGGLLTDTEIFGTNDFSSGFGTVSVGNWYVIAISKASGTVGYRYHEWTYASPASGTMAHGTTSGTHANWSAATAIQLFAGPAGGAHCTIAVAAMWNRVLSDSELDTLVSNNLSDWNALTPDWAVHLGSWTGTAGTDVVWAGGGATGTLTGAVGSVANPTGFNFTLSAPPTVVEGGPQVQLPGFMASEAFPAFMRAFTGPANPDAIVSAPQSVAADTAVLSLTGIDPGASGTGAASVAADVAALTLAGVDPGASGSGAASTALDVAALLFTGIDPGASGSGAASVAADVATLTFTGIDPSVSGGPVTVAADTATLTLSGIDVTGAGSGASSNAADVASLSFAGVDPGASGTGVASQAADFAVLTFTGVDLSGGGAILTALDTAALSLSGVDVIGSGSGATAISADIAALSLTGINVSAVGTGAAAVLADPGVLTLTGIDPTAHGTGVASVVANTAVLTLSGVEVVSTAYLPDPNALTVTVHDSGHTTTVRAPNARLTQREPTKNTLRENR